METFVDLVRIAWSGRRGWSSRIAIAALGSALSAVVLLAALATTQVLDLEAARVESRTPVLAKGPTLDSGVWLRAGQLAYERLDQSLIDQTLTRVLLSAGAGAVITPPGLNRVPKPGEVFVSPALARVLRQPGAQRRVPAIEPVGLIQASGLRNPGELLMYQGVDLSQMSSPRLVTGFGQRDPLLRETLSKYAGNTLLVFVLAPSMVLFGLVGRGFARRREPQLRALRLVGAPPSMLRAVVVADVLVASGLGAALGAGVFEVGRRLLHRVPLVDHEFLARDASLDAAWILALVVGLPILAATTAVLSTGRAAAPVIGLRATLVPVRPRLLSLTPLLASVFILLAMTFVSGLRRAGPVTAALWTVAVIGVVIGLPLAMATILGAVSRRLAPTTSLAGMLGLRRLGYRQGGEARLAGALGAAVFVVGVGVVYAHFLPAPIAPDRLPAGGLAVRIVGAASGPVPASFKPESVLPDQRPIPVVAVTGARGQQRSAVIVDCSQVRLLLGPSVKCPRTPTVVVASTDEAVLFGSDRRYETQASRRALRVARSPLVSPHARAAQLGGQLLIPRTVLGPDATVEASGAMSYVAVLPGPRGLAQLRGVLMTQAPSVAVTFPTDFQSVRSDTQRATSWLVLCVLAAALVLFAAFMSAAADVSQASRGYGFALKVTSPPRGLLMRAHLYSAALPPVLGTLLGLTVGILGGQMIASTRGFPMPWSAFWWIGTGGLAASIAAAALTIPAAMTDRRALHSA